MVVLVRIAIIFLLTSVALGDNSTQDEPRYVNMYGPEEDTTPRYMRYLKTAYGALKYLKENFMYLNDEFSDTTPSSKDLYDFIVVGAGSAGAPVAARLSEEKTAKVLLLEAGGNEHLLYDIPLLGIYTKFIKTINWDYKSEPSDQYCRAMTDKKCLLTRGKVMGGTSVLNFMIVTRGFPKNYDGWAAMGNEGWAYKDVLKYFKKLESVQIDKLKSQTDIRGTKGPVPISYPPYRSPLAKAFVEAGIELGYRQFEMNEKNQNGFAFLQSNTKDGERYSSNRAYLHPIKNRKNLHVSRNSHVNRVLIDPKTNRAYGVEFTKFGETITVNATKEVILCAGAFGSPHILMLSGIGPKEDLMKNGINVIKDAPSVGKNLMDHIVYGGTFYTVNQPVSITEPTLLNFSKPYLNDYLLHRKGPVSTIGGQEAIAYIDVEKDPDDPEADPQGELCFAIGSPIATRTIHDVLGISGKVWDDWMASSYGREAWMAFTFFLYPKSRGWLQLKNSDPQTLPAIYPNYYDHPDDVKTSIKIIREINRVSKTEAMQRFKSTLFAPKLTGCEDFEDDSDEYLECAMRSLSLTLYHFCGTCKMGPENDTTAVVNPRLKVIGIEGLRVADASIIPTIPGAHLNIPSMMIGEKLADMVKEDWGFHID